MVHCDYPDPIDVSVTAASRGGRHAWGLATAGGLRLSAVLPEGAAREEAVLAAFAAVLDHPRLQCAPIDLYTNDARFHEALVEMRLSMPHIEPHLYGGPSGGHPSLREALLEARAALDSAGVLAPPAHPLIAATDGSYSRGHGGWGWITQCGSYGFGAQRYSNATAAELAAISALLQSAPPTRPLRILTDCKPAMRLIERICGACTGTQVPHNLTGHQDTDRLLAAIGRRVAEGRDLRLGWVRGHSGHPLNEAADRLALLGRRTARAGVARAVADEVGSRIAEETRAAVAGMAVPEFAVAVTVSTERAPAASASPGTSEAAEEDGAAAAASGRAEAARPSAAARTAGRTAGGPAVGAAAAAPRATSDHAPQRTEGGSGSSDGGPGTGTAPSDGSPGSGTPRTRKQPAPSGTRTSSPVSVA